MTALQHCAGTNVKEKRSSHSNEDANDENQQIIVKSHTVYKYSTNLPLAEEIVLDGRVGIAAFDILDNAFGDAGAQRVDRRVVDRDDADPVDILEANQCGFRHSDTPC